MIHRAALARQVAVSLAAALWLAGSARAGPVDWDAFRAGLQRAPAAAQDRLVEEFLRRSGPPPLVEGTRLVFLVQGDPAAPPRLLGDLFGWGGEADGGSELGGSERGKGAAMQRLGASHWFERAATAEAGARIEYLIERGGRLELDPRNPRRVRSVGGPVSEVRVAGCADVPGLSGPRPAAHGRIEERWVVFRDGKRRHVTTYVAATPSGRGGPERLPFVLFHDGDLMLGAGDVPAILDRLIAAGRLASLVAAFVAPADRSADYSLDPAWRAAMLGELLPDLDARLPIAREPERRAVVGVSRGSVGALDLARSPAAAFGRSVLLLPAYRPVPLLAALPARSFAGRRADVVLGRYDGAWLADGRALVDALRTAGASVTVTEVPEGHATQTWRRALVGALLRFAPGPRPVPSAASDP